MHCRDYVENIYGMISNDDFITLLTDIRRKSSSIDEAGNVRLTGRSEHCIKKVSTGVLLIVLLDVCIYVSVCGLQGIKFVDSIYALYLSMDCQDVMDSEICDWLSGLINLITIKSKDQFGLFLDAALPVIEKYENFLKQYVGI